MFNPIEASKNIKEEFISYILTSFSFADPILKKKFEENLVSMVSKGPYLEINDVFKSGKSIQELVDEGLLSKLFLDLEKEKRANGKKEILPINRPLYLHQEKAIRTLVSGGNAVISTGTGSGKTNCFLIPILNDLLREKEKGTLGPGVRALFIYPMNALANDQLKNIRRLLMDYESITFGVYNGATEYTEKDAISMYKSMFANETNEKLRNKLNNEILSREQMKDTPPNILFTNYAMLEHMLFRPNDDIIFTNSDFKFVVLDEAHVYSGATGIETSILLRRLRARINSTRETQFILTSATLGTSNNFKKHAYEDITNFAENLCGVKFNEDNIIVSEREKYHSNPNAINYPYECIKELANEENAVSDVLKKYKITFNSKLENELLYEFIESSLQYQIFRSNISKVTPLHEIAEIMGTTEENCIAFIAICSRASKNGKALIDARYHFFIRSLEGCFITLSPQKNLSLNRKTKINDYFAFEVAICDDCGKFALVGKIVDGILTQVSKINGDVDYYYLCDDENNDIVDEDELQDTASKKEVYYLCPHCGAIVEERRMKNKPCDHDPSEYIKIIKARRANNDKSKKTPKCVNCRRGYYQRVYLGNDAATSVLATSLYEELPELSYEENDDNEVKAQNIFTKIIVQNKKKTKKTGRQFLVFSDSRQEAAKFACYLKTSYDEFLRRRGICHIINEHKKEIINGNFTISDFVKKLTAYFSNTRSFASNANDASNLTTISNKNAWIAMINELARTNSSTSLTSLGVLQFEYLGNSDEIINGLAEDYKVNKQDVEDLLNLLIFEIVKAGAICTDSDTDLDDNDREYIFYTPKQRFITRIVNLDEQRNTIKGWEARQKPGKQDEYYKTNKLYYVMHFLNLSEKDAAQFLSEYYTYLIDPKSNCYCMTDKNNDGNYVLPARYFRVRVKGDPSIKWYKCPQCGRVSPYQQNGHCISINCNSVVKEINPEDLSENNHFSRLYFSDRMSPLFIKEHTAQLSKKESAIYQEKFIKKEINALSCSTTFEMGVDVGDLDTVFLRDVPPLPSNYAQRAGRAGRSLKSVAYCLTFAKLSSHDLSFFKDPKKMIDGTILPPIFKVDNEKIVKRHVYSVALSMFFKIKPEFYNKNDAEKFINEKGYTKFFDWLDSKPENLKNMLKRSIPDIGDLHERIGIKNFGWLEDFKGENGTFTVLLREYENNVKQFENLIKKYKRDDIQRASKCENKMKRYMDNRLIDFLARGNILPKYGFPVDTVELEQNTTADNINKLRLSRDLSIAIAEYAPSSEVIADGKLYTSRYIKKTNSNDKKDWRTAYIGVCPNKYCQATNYSLTPISKEGVRCVSCGQILHESDFSESIEPVSGFVTERTAKDVPLSRQEKNYKSEDVYIGNVEAKTIEKYAFKFNGIDVKVESTTNDSLMVKSTNNFYVCSKCGYALAEDEKIIGDDVANKGIANKVHKITTETSHESLFSQSNCDCHDLYRYSLHHVFNTDVAKISFGCDTTDRSTMLSSMYAILYAISDYLNIERKDINACLSWIVTDNKIKYSIIIYDSVPGGAGHSRRLITDDGELLENIFRLANENMESCDCDPSCYNCLRSYENQKIHEELDRKKAANFLRQLIGKVEVIK